MRQGDVSGLRLPVVYSYDILSRYADHCRDSERADGEGAAKFNHQAID